MPHSLSHYRYILESVISKGLQKRERERGLSQTHLQLFKVNLQPFLKHCVTCALYRSEPCQQQGTSEHFVHLSEGISPCSKGGAYCQLEMMSEVALLSLYVSKKISMLWRSLIGKGMGSSLDTLQVCWKDRGEPLRKLLLTINCKVCRLQAACIMPRLPAGKVISQVITILIFGTMKQS